MNNITVVVISRNDEDVLPDAHGRGHRQILIDRGDALPERR